MIFQCLYRQSIPRGSNVLYILFAHPSCLLVEKWQPRQIYLVSLVKLLIERKSQTNITSFFKKADQNHEKNDDVIYVGGMYFLLTILLQDDAEDDPFIL